MNNENKPELKITTEQEILSEFIKTLDSVELDVLTILLKDSLVMDEDRFDILIDKLNEETFLSEISLRLFLGSVSKIVNNLQQHVLIEHDKEAYRVLLEANECDVLERYNHSEYWQITWLSKFRCLDCDKNYVALKVQCPENHNPDVIVVLDKYHRLSD
jgi:hypothetical protein